MLLATCTFSFSEVGFTAFADGFWGCLLYTSTEEMTDRVSRSVEQMRGAAEQVTSRTPITAIQASKTVSDNYTDAKLDHRKLKKLILEAINEANEKPIVLNGRQMNRFMREEGFVKV